MPDTPELLAQTIAAMAPTGEQDSEGNDCYAELIFDGANRGMWIANAVVELAKEYGWTDSDPSEEDIEAHRLSGSDGEMLLTDTATYAENWLNEITPEGWSFGFSDGDFFLANDAWWNLDSE